MNIDIKHNIVILDEAHNIEDSSREAASLTVNQEQLLAAKSDLEKLVYNEINPQTCQPLVCFLSFLCRLENKIFISILLLLVVN